MKLQSSRPQTDCDSIEQSLLGCCLLDSDALDSAGFIKPEDFGLARHAKLYRIMRDMKEAKFLVDMPTVISKARDIGLLEDLGGASYIVELSEYVSSADRVVAYAKILKDKARKRRVVEVANDLMMRAHGDEPIDSILAAAESALFSLGNEGSKGGARHIRHGLKAALTNIEASYSSKGKVHGIVTGIGRLDMLLGGLRPGKLYIVAGRPAMGKTAFAMNMVEAAAHKDNIPTLFYSLEMPEDELAERELCGFSRVSASRARIGLLETSDFSRLSDAAEALHKLPVWIDDEEGLPVPEMRSRARREVKKNKIGMIVVDYLQLMRGSRKYGNRQEEISEISRELKSMAKELRVPVVALSQLSRELERRENKRPMLSDLRESGSIEQDADVVMFLYREAVYCDQCRQGVVCGKEHENKAEIIIAKQRGGPTGTVNALWFPEHTKFVEA